MNFLEARMDCVSAVTFGGITDRAEGAVPELHISKEQTPHKP